MSRIPTTEAVPDRGRLAETPLPRLLLGLQREKPSGSLRLRQAQVEKCFQLRDGSPALVESSRTSEGLISLLVEQGRMGPEQQKKAVQLMRARECKELAALMALKVLGPKELLLALRDQIQRSLIDCFAWREGEFELQREETAAQESPSLHIDLLALTQQGIAAHWRADQTLTALGERVSEYPRPGSLFGQARRSLHEDEPLRALLDALDGSLTTWTALQRANSPLALAAFWVLDAVGALEYSAEARVGELDASASEARDDVEIEILVSGTAKGAQGDTRASEKPKAAGQEAAAKQRVAELAALRAEVRDKHARLAEISLYELLGVERKASPAQIKRAYLKAAKRLHPDALSRLGLGDVKQEANEVFAQVGKAHATLSDPEERRSYDASLEGHTTVDANQVAQAEALYRKGEILLRAGNFLGALEFLQAAVSLWPEEADYQSAYGWALYRKNPPESERARKHLEKAIAIDATNAETHRRLGLVLKALGEQEAAAAALARARRLGAPQA